MPAVPGRTYLPWHQLFPLRNAWRRSPGVSSFSAHSPRWLDSTGARSDDAVESRPSLLREIRMTENTDLDALLARVALLERRNEELARRGRRLTGAFAALFLPGAAVLLVAAQPPRARSIEAERIVLRDANGRERAVLSVEADKDRVSLALRDVAGKARVRLVAAADEAGMSLAD